MKNQIVKWSARKDKYQSEQINAEKSLVQTERKLQLELAEAKTQTNTPPGLYDPMLRF